jgi:hypothetical protein
MRRRTVHRHRMFSSWNPEMIPHLLARWENYIPGGQVAGKQ